MFPNDYVILHPIIINLYEYFKKYKFYARYIQVIII